MRLADDFSEKFIMLIGDGLTQIRVRMFRTMIRESAYRFEDSFTETDMTRKALRKITHITGDLHGGRFHFLSSVCSLFYGFFSFLLDGREFEELM